MSILKPLPILDLRTATTNYNAHKTDRLATELEQIASRAGTQNSAFIRAYDRFKHELLAGRAVADILDSKLMVRALVVALDSEYGAQLIINQAVVSKIEAIKPRASYLTIEGITQYILARFDEVGDLGYLCKWVKKQRRRRGMGREPLDEALSPKGAQWLCRRCIEKGTRFTEEYESVGLSEYPQGRFHQLATSLYFLKRLEAIPENKNHELLDEAKSQSVYTGKYDKEHLLGHKILEVLIRRAPETDVHDSWLGVVMKIAGDPRVSKTHPNYRRWWWALDASHQNKVIGWLSRLDLRLFLEALKNFGIERGDAELNRMFPSRKVFLEGLLNRNLITGTRLYLSNSAAKYIRSNYREEDLPQFSYVQGGSRSILHIQLGGAHLIEGSHSCFLWVYPKLDETAIVFDYEERSVSYDQLTSGMSDEMYMAGTPNTAQIRHSPFNYKWQRDAIEELREIGIDVSPSDVLSPVDYRKYKRIYGVNYGA